MEDFDFDLDLDLDLDLDFDFEVFEIVVGALEGMEGMLEPLGQYAPAVNSLVL